VRGGVVVLATTTLLPSMVGEGGLAKGIKAALTGIVLVTKLLPCPAWVVQVGYLSPSPHLLLPQVAYLLLLLLPLTSRAPRLTLLLQSTTFLTFLLHSPTHLPVLALLLLQLHLLPPALAPLPPSLLPLVWQLVGRVGTFQLGGSNSLATVAVGAAYTGLTSYHPVPVTLLLAVHTYSAPLLALLHHASLPSTLPSLLHSLTLTLGSEVVVFTALATHLRHHLFVWTVFSPKLLYLGMALVVHTVAATVISVLQ